MILDENNSSTQYSKESDYFYDAGKIFTATTDLNELLNSLLELTAKYFHIERGMIHVYEEETEKIVIDVSYGYSKEEVNRGIYKPGEGIIGNVISSGKPAVIPLINEEPMFLNKTKARQNSDKKIAFLCFPIRLAGEVIGTLSLDIPNNDLRKDFQNEIREFSAIAVMVAHAVNHRRELRKQEEKFETEKKKLNLKLSEKRKLHKIIGESRLMRDLYEKILLVAETNSTVLITGESGTGKELIADAVQIHSLRKDNPYVKVNIAALPENLIESELFGYEKGAFTGATTQKRGRFELANGGTIFLDEIGDLSYPLQVKLLRVLQEKTIERVGGNTVIPLDVRIIAATHQNLESKIAKNEFRADLYYRLNVYPIHASPLRERKADIISLADYFIVKYSKELNKPVKRISSEAIDMLTLYHWPGNVRELENVIQRAVIVSMENTIRSFHLPPTLQMAEKDESAPKSFEEMVNQYEKEIIIDYLKITGGNITKAAQLLKTTKRILTYKVKNLYIDYSRYKKNNNGNSD